MAAWIICGVAASGKTSLAKALAKKTGFLFLDADDFHPPSNIEKMRSHQALAESDREAWLSGLEQRLESERGRDLVLAFPGLKRSHRERLAKAAGQAEFLFLKISLEVAWERLRRRGGFFPASLISSQFEMLEMPTDALLLGAQQELPELERQALKWMEGKL
jgi:gluconokinase